MIRQIFVLQNPWLNNPEYRLKLRTRDILETLLENMHNELIMGLLGSRQVGKSSLIHLLIQNLLDQGISTSQIFYFNLDDLELQKLFQSLPEFIQFIGNDSGKKYVFIDEIQRLESPGLFLKEVFDLHRDIKIVYSGSAQLEIKAKVKEHLVGRSRVFHINRLSFGEYLDFAAPITRKQALEDIMIFGSYPAVALASDSLNKRLRIKDIFQSYIQKDLIDFIDPREVDLHNKFLIRLAMQSGELLNIHSISKSLSIQRKKVDEYLNILEHTFVTKRIYPFHKNFQKEITKTPKLFFLDLGIRNYILNDFRDFSLRTDIGHLFENLFLIEILAKDFHGLNRINFWRTINGTEIDFVVQGEQDKVAYELKWAKKNEPRSFQSFRDLYPTIQTKLVNQDWFLELF